MSTIKLILLAGVLTLANAQTEQYYDALKDFCEGALTAYEPTGYSFPRLKCFNETTQTAILDDAIAIASFASAGRWNHVEKIVDEVIQELYGGATGCHVFLLRDHVRESFENSSLNDWSVRLLVDNHMIRRYCLSITKDIGRKGWKEAGFELGSCLHYLLPPL